jgi:hypothetical protein
MTDHGGQHHLSLFLVCPAIQMRDTSQMVATVLFMEPRSARAIAVHMLYCFQRFVHAFPTLSGTHSFAAFSSKHLSSCIIHISSSLLSSFSCLRPQIDRATSERGEWMDWVTLRDTIDPLHDHLLLAEVFIFRRLRAQYALLLYMLLPAHELRIMTGSSHRPHIWETSRCCAS